MIDAKSAIRVVFILGPTASGKTNLAIKAAQKMGGEIINADSIQVYKSLNIGSAKPTKEELEAVPHHLIGHLAEGSAYTAGQFRREVLEVIEKRSREGIQKFYIVGGSGFYIKALINGLYKVPDIPVEIQEKVKNEKTIDLYEELKRVDPENAKILNANDSYRIARAIEVYRATGIPFSEYKNKFSEEKFPYKCIKIGLRTDKENLRNRVLQRTEKMLKEGLIEEVKDLVEKGLEEWDALQSVGYKEVQLFLKGLLPQDQLREEIVKNTMGLIKRQMTWFKKDIDMTWFDVSLSEDLQATEKIVQFIEEEM
ncbi:MAG: tRNA (adenosine(37)-N6)-dimethylallyltransferase MiaA [Bdellovibrionota bacterium]